jgi:hypothetical protein
VKLLDERETVLIIVGADIIPEERDRPTAYELKRAVDERGKGKQHRRAVVLTDVWHSSATILQQNPTIAIGGPGVNALSMSLVESLPVAVTDGKTYFIQFDSRSTDQRVVIWGISAEATREGVQRFVSEGHLDSFLDRLWTDG